MNPDEAWIIAHIQADGCIIDEELGYTNKRKLVELFKNKFEKIFKIKIQKIRFHNGVNINCKLNGPYISGFGSKTFELLIQGKRNLKNLAKHIGFDSSEKRRKLIKLLNSFKHLTSIELPGQGFKSPSGRKVVS